MQTITEPVANTPAAPGAVRVLIIDDNETFAESVKLLLEPLGYQVAVAVSPIKALELFTREKGNIDLVLVDYFMPEMDGAKTFEWLRKLNPNVKVILCSGAEVLKLKQVCAQYRIDDYIHKPFRVHDAQLTIRRVMER